jgi:hypothetical protein
MIIQDPSSFHRTMTQYPKESAHFRSNMSIPYSDIPKQHQTNKILFFSGWYSHSTYYIVKIIIDSVQTLIITIVHVCNLYYKYRSIDLILYCLISFSISLLSIQSLGHIGVIILGNKSIYMYLVLFSVIFMLSGSFVTEKDLPVLIKYLIKLNPLKATYEQIMILFYGFFKCAPGEQHPIMDQMGWTDQTYYENQYLLFFLASLYALMDFFFQKFKIR